MNNWENNILLKKRIPILKSAIKAHLKKDYWLSIPTILPQIEGLLTSGYKHSGKANSKHLKKYIEELLKDDYYKNRNLNETLKKFMNEIFYKNFEHGTFSGYSPNRHAILHGADTNYGTASNSLKAILIFDYLQRAFRLVYLKNSKIFHLVGCPTLYKQNTKGELKFFRYSFEAIKSNLKPCKKCNPPYEIL